MRSSTAFGDEATIATGMSITLVNDLIFLFCGQNSLAAAATHRMRDRIIVLAARQQHAALHPLVHAGVLRFCSLLLLCFLSGCGSSSSGDSQFKPRMLKTSVVRLSLVSFSPDGSRLAVGGTSGEVLVWGDLNSSPVVMDSGHTAPLVSLTWSPDGLLIASDLDRGFVGWQLSGAKKERVELPKLPAPAVCVAFRPNVSSLEMVIGLRDGSLFFLDSRGTKQYKPDHRGSVKQVTYSPDGRWLISAGADGQLIWRDASSRVVAQATKAHDSEISHLLWDKEGRRLITGDWNGQIQVWDAETRKSISRLQQADGVAGLGWAGKRLVTGGWNGQLKIWNLSTNACLHTFSAGQTIQSLAADSKTQRVATVGDDGSVSLWDLTESVTFK